MASRQCQVCHKAQSKYKCPNCLVPYCSLSCFKKHKETPCEKPLPKVEETVLPAETPIQKTPLQVEFSSWTINQEQLQSIVESTDVQEALQDRGLQNLIQRIDSSKNPEDELEEAMKGQVFHDFADKILSIVSQEED